AFDQTVIFDACADRYTQARLSPFFFVIEIRNGTARSVARKSGGAAVGIYDLAAEIGVLAVVRPDERNAVRTGAFVPVADGFRKLINLRIFGKIGFFNDDIIVAETMKFAEWDAHILLPSQFN